MNRVIVPGDRVMVTPVKKGITHKSYKATVIGWMSSGKLNVQPDGDKRQRSKLVNPDDVKKLADKQAPPYPLTNHDWPCCQLPLIEIHAETQQPLTIAMTQEQMKAVWARKVALQTTLRALADLPENKRAISELKEGIDACNTELISGTYNPPLAVD